MKKYAAWTEEDKEFVINNYNKMAASDIAKKLGRNITSIYSQVHTLKGKGYDLKAKTHKMGWSREETQQLKELYTRKSTKEIAKKLNRSVSVVYKKGDELGLIKKRSSVYTKIIDTEDDIKKGLNLDDLKFTKGKYYHVRKLRGKQGTQTEGQGDFKGGLIQETSRHITLKGKLRRESFLKVDLMIGEYEIREMTV